MKKTLSLIFLSIVFCCPAFAQGEINGRVVEIVDGKTVVIEVSTRNKIVAELRSIEVPEPEQPLYQTVKDHLGQILLGRQVAFKPQRLTETKTVGQIFANGIDVSQQMIRDGAAWFAVDEDAGQSSPQSEIYQKTEAQAKTEKLGIWSIENLKPAWQIRAERAEFEREQARLAAEKAKKEAAESGAKTAAAKSRNSAYRPVMNNESRLLAASDPALKLPPNVQFVGGLLVGYNPSIKLGVIATPLLSGDFSNRAETQRLAVQILYMYYDADATKGRQSVYLVCVDSVSNEYKFLKENDLIVTADKQKINLGKARRFVRETTSGVRESLIYEIKKNVFEQIAEARNLEIKVGAYSKNTNAEIQQMLHNLLQTSL